MSVYNLLLLVVLWAAACAEAGEPQPPTEAGGSLDSGQQLRQLVGEVSELRTMLDRLAGQVERLDSRLDGIEGRFDALDAKQSSLDSLVSRPDSTNGELTARLEEIETRTNTGINRLSSNIDQLAYQVTNELTPRLNEANWQIYSTKTRLTSRLDQLVSHVDSEDAELGSRLDEFVSRLDSGDAELGSRMDELVSRVDSEDAELGSRLDNFVSQVNSSDAELSSRLDNLTSVVDVRARLLPRDCSELPEGSQSGTYLIQPRLYRSGPPVAAFCDLDTDGGGWTVIQRRADIQPRQNFNLTWAAYREGFGDLDKEFWWGLENLWRLTGVRDRQYELRVDLADFAGGRGHAVYRRFRVASSADGYRLSVGQYSGNAGDSLVHHNGQRFSTHDRDQDGSSGHCAQAFGGGWWFRNCRYANLNGHYVSGGRVDWKGIIWHHWKSHYSMKSAEMKVRPVNTD